MSTMRIDSLYALKYIGSKRRMAEILKTMIPSACSSYVEPFCGSAALALNCGRQFERMILNDLNPGIANFWRVASSPQLGYELLKKLEKTRYSRTLFEEAKERREEYGANRQDLVEWGADLYILTGQSFNGLGDSWRDGDHEAYMRHITSLEGLPLALKTLWDKKVEVHNENALDLLSEGNYLNDEHTFIFLDPPYLEGLRSDGKLYQTDMPDVRDHIDLLNLVKNVKAKILLSGYWSGYEGKRDLYGAYLLPYGWHRHGIGGYVKSCQSGDGEKAIGNEYIWTNYEIEGPMLAALMEKKVVINADSSCSMKKNAVQSSP